MAEENPSLSGPLGIVPTSRSDPYEGDTPPEDAFAEMFEDDDPADEVDSTPEPATFDDDDEPQAPPPPEDDEETETEASAAETEEEPVSGEETEEPPALYAGRFARTDEGLAQFEQAYKEAQGWATRASQDLQRAEARQSEMEEVLSQQQEQFNQLVNLVTNQMAEADPEFAERLQQQQAIQQAVQSYLPDEEDEETQEEYEQRTYQQEAAVNVSRWYASSGVAPNSPEDQALTRAVAIAAQSGVPVDMRRADHLDALLEASRDENLLLELTMAPNAINIPGGIARLKGRLAGATVRATTSTPSPEQETQSRSTQQPRRRRVEAHVESPGGGAPADAAPGQTGTDEWSEAEEWYRKRYNKGPIFGGKR